MRNSIFLIAGLLFSSLSLAAPKYIDLKPLDQIVKTQPGAVLDGVQSLPIITWGADIATIHANGATLKTSPSSIFGKKGLSYKLTRDDVFSSQLENYIEGDTPFLRGTLGMINSASDLLSGNPDLQPVVFYQLSWSAGGDALVVKNGINSVKDLKGKTIALQAYGPHMDYIGNVLGSEGLSFNDVTVKWLPDLTGTDDAPMAAFYESDIDAAFMIIPDALALTSGGTVGTGAEDSVKGASILMSTKTADGVIADAYAVRADYYKQNQSEVEQLTRGLLEAAQEVESLVKHRKKEVKPYKELITAAAKFLLDSPQAIADTEGLYADMRFAHLSGNTQMFESANHPLNFANMNESIGGSLRELGVLSGSTKILNASINYKRLSQGLNLAEVAKKPRFNSNELSSLVSRKQQQGTLDEGELFSFEVFFTPNQNDFPVDLYQKEFQRVIELAASYGGAVITVEGHSDPMGYLRAKKNNKPSVVLSRTKQSAKNLSISRAQSVRDEIVTYAKSMNVALDESQFEPIGHGITNPSTGICGNDPCVPKTAEEWRSNMRVVFRIIQIEAESDVFMPL